MCKYSPVLLKHLQPSLHTWKTRFSYSLSLSASNSSLTHFHSLLLSSVYQKRSHLRVRGIATTTQVTYFLCHKTPYSPEPPSSEVEKNYCVNYAPDTQFGPRFLASDNGLDISFWTRHIFNILKKRFVKDFIYR